jgi:catechol 2,3-dioxygenase-like lactoylglutathione lyase family enzyme
MNLNGIHHVTAVSRQIGHNVDFYTRVLGLRLVKKSVNQTMSAPITSSMRTNSAVPVRI